MCKALVALSPYPRFSETDLTCRCQTGQDEVVRAEDLAEGGELDVVHGTGLKIYGDGTGDVPAAGGLIVVDVDLLELEIGAGVSAIPSDGVNAVLVADDLPEPGADLVAALASLDVQVLSLNEIRFLKVVEFGQKKGRGKRDS
ncbi:tubulin beta-1 chain-like [Pyrus ussuriensis x Pyrus communis]|uniref:Tubulin beta-1 chain-like n=1 Tax=Pyrus ussuriensis x Pyrus communis TaxID=2448454 RepID=A0A5N5IP93_9ROSA|nr:tubulin beta-1 chain-like [Pyrus ussuriensis x Pyrus communis]